MRLNNCEKCGKRLSTDKRRKGNSCRSCIIAIPETPEAKAKRIAAIKLYWATNPERRLQQAEMCRSHMTPERRARAADAIRRNRTWEKTPPEALAKWQKSGVIAARERHLGWCPHELRNDYRDLRVKKGLSATEAREIILAQHEKNMAAFRRKLGAA